MALITLSASEAVKHAIVFSLLCPSVRLCVCACVCVCVCVPFSVCAITEKLLIRN